MFLAPATNFLDRTSIRSLLLPFKSFPIHFHRSFHHRGYVHLENDSILNRARLWHVGAAGRLIIWLPPPLKPIIFKLFRLWQGWRILWRAHARIADNFRRYTFARENLGSLTPYFPLFQIRLSAPYRLATVGTCPVGPPLSPTTVKSDNDVRDVSEL
jgi:hypothetical protein